MKYAADTHVHYMKSETTEKCWLLGSSGIRHYTLTLKTIYGMLRRTNVSSIKLMMWRLPFLWRISAALKISRKLLKTTK
jgi:hypothetical protein